MNRRSRTDYSVINSFVGSLSQVSSLVIGFITQTIFINSLGATYLGIKGLFSNILSVLSFSELGIGVAITYSLYKPLAKKDTEKIILIMNFFKKVYTIIGIFIGIFGVFLIPFIHFFTHQNIPYLYAYYLLFLLNTVVSYFFTYKRTLLNADQLSYLNLINQIIFKIIQAIFQIIILIVFKSFFGFLIVQLVCTVLSNIIISIQVDKRYPYLLKNNLKNKKTPKNILNEIFHNTIGLIGTKISSVIVMGSDNALISYFTNLYQAGIYSNYMFIINGVTSVFSQATGSLSASVGNLVVQDHNSDKQYDIFEKCFFIVETCTFFSSICLLVLMDSFIDIWVGKKYEFAFFVTFLLVFNFIIMGLRQAFYPFVSAYGLYVKDGIKAFIESVINLILSIFYAKYLKLGVAAIILGTISSNILVNWYEPYMILKYGIKKDKYIQVYCKYLTYICINLVSIFLVRYLLSWCEVMGIFSFIIKLVLTVIISLILYFLIFYKNKNFVFLLRTINKIFFRR